MRNKGRFISGVFIALCTVMFACLSAGMNAQDSQISPGAVELKIDRLPKIPTTAIKVLPETDLQPPIVHSGDYEQPAPLPGMVNTAGAEDSPFILPDGHTLYFFFTPDVAVPAERQILDGVTGIYVSKSVDGQWVRPERIVLQDPGKLAGDGCVFVLGDQMWFCSAREGYADMQWFTAIYKNQKWQNWQQADFKPEYKVGELHITVDGTELYFHSGLPGGAGDLDIWVSKKVSEEWQKPVNVAAVNTSDGEGWPAISPDGSELWFTRNYAIWRSKKVNGEWQEAEMIVSGLAGEPSIDSVGNLFFVHHFFQNGQMIEADIYVAYRK